MTIIGIAHKYCLSSPWCWASVVQREVFVGNLTEEIVTSPRDVKRLMAVGEGMKSFNRGRSIRHTLSHDRPIILDPVLQRIGTSAAPMPTSEAVARTPSSGWFVRVPVRISLVRESVSSQAGPPTALRPQPGRGEPRAHRGPQHTRRRRREGRLFGETRTADSA